MASESSADLTSTSASSDSSTATSKVSIKAISLLVAPHIGGRVFFFLNCFQVSCAVGLSIHSVFFLLRCVLFFFCSSLPLFLLHFVFSVSFLYFVVFHLSLLFSISVLCFVFSFMLKQLKLRFLFSTIIIVRFWFFLFSFCFVDFGFCYRDFVSSMHVVFGKQCCLFSLFWFFLFRLCFVHALCVLQGLLFQHGFGI